MKTDMSIELIVHYPETEEGKQELARRISEVHADYVTSTINKLNCSVKQKLELLQAVIDTSNGTYKSPELKEKAKSFSECHDMKP